MTKPDARPGPSSVQSTDLDAAFRQIERAQAADSRIEAFPRTLRFPR
jgi:hypothetical protein